MLSLPTGRKLAINWKINIVYLHNVIVQLVKIVWVKQRALVDCRTKIWMRKHILFHFLVKFFMWVQNFFFSWVTQEEFVKSPTAFNNPSWQIDEPRCESCSLVLHNNSIHCKKDSIYFIYAQVTFRKRPNGQHTKSVILIRNPTNGKRVKTLVEGTFPNTTEGSVWVARIVRLKRGDSVSLNITGDFFSENTFWGAYQLH